MFNINKKFYNFDLFLLLLLISFSIWYGIYRGYFIGLQHTLGITISALGYSLDVSHNKFIFDFRSHSQLIPYGTGMVEMSLYYITVSLLNRLVNNIELSSSIFYTIIYLISLIFCYKFFFKLTKNKYITLLFIILYYLHPFFMSQGGIPPIELAMLVLPLSLYYDIILFDYINKNKEISINLSFLNFISKLLITSCSWYVGVIVAVAESLFFFFYFILSKNNFSKNKIVLLYIFYVIVPWFLSMFLILLTKDRNSTYIKESIDIFRGLGVDLITLFIPSNHLLLSKIYSLSDFINDPNKVLIGDNATTSGNYIGIGLLVCFIIFLIKHRNFYKNKLNSYPYISLFFVFILTLLLSLGVGLKYEAVKEVGPITYQSYLLNENQVLFDFPWKFIFKIFPFCYMRATYRWLLVTNICLLIFAACLFKELIKKRSKLIIFLILLLLLDFIPRDLSNNSILKYNSYIKDFYNDVISPLKKYNFNTSDKIIFTMSENDFLAPYLASKVGFLTYNGAGDKSNIIAKEYVPLEVTKIKEEKDPINIYNLLLKIRDKNLAEYVILPFFSLRWSSYSWPVDNNTYTNYKKIADDVISNLKEDSYISFKYLYLINIKKL